MAKKKDVVNDKQPSYESIDSDNPFNLPDLYIKIPTDPKVDISNWCLNIKKANRKYHIIFQREIINV